LRESGIDIGSKRRVVAIVDEHLAVLANDAADAEPVPGPLNGTGGRTLPLIWVGYSIRLGY
jgi:hypothetical protein